jgi:hypothetical protein
MKEIPLIPFTPHLQTNEDVLENQYAYVCFLSGQFAFSSSIQTISISNSVFASISTSNGAVFLLPVSSFSLTKCSCLNSSSSSNGHFVHVFLSTGSFNDTSLAKTPNNPTLRAAYSVWMHNGILFLSRSNFSQNVMNYQVQAAELRSSLNPKIGYVDVADTIGNVPISFYLRTGSPKLEMTNFLNNRYCAFVDYPVVVYLTTSAVSVEVRGCIFQKNQGDPLYSTPFAVYDSIFDVSIPSFAIRRNFTIATLENFILFISAECSPPSPFLSMDHQSLLQMKSVCH